MSDDEDADSRGDAVAVDRRTILKTGGAAGAAGLAGIAGYFGYRYRRAGPKSHADVAMVFDHGEYENSFCPNIVWIEEGGTVTWHNESGVHNTTAYHPDNDRPQRIPETGEPWRSPVGEDYIRTFAEEGVYDYFCLPHEQVGMVGSVIVGHPDPAEEPGLTEPQQELYREAQDELRVLNQETRAKLERDG